MAGYGTDVDFQAWLAAQGLTLPSTAPTPAVLRQIGSDYVDAAYGWRLQCSAKTGGYEQGREWPRTGHLHNGAVLPDDLIPPAWINASYRAAYLQATTPGWATGGVNPGRLTKREKVDVIEREFFAPGDGGGSGDIAPGSPFDAYVNGLVGPWLCSMARGLNTLFRVV